MSARAANRQVADKLRQAADLLGQQGANPFRVGAYRRAADAIAHLGRDVREIVDQEGSDGLVALPHVGQGIAAAILEMLRTGRWSQLERLRGTLDPVRIFRTVPGIGPALAQRVHDTLAIDTLEALEMAAHDGRLETVPGMIISQHSGEGKANQYYLRGFNLDHGFDFAQTVAGIPVNMPTHAHAQGYADANFLIPELVSGVQFRKGPYYAENGDFSSAGSANFNYFNVLERPVVALSGGSFDYGRVFAAASPRVAVTHTTRFPASRRAANSPPAR